eukprot:7851619-Karenia_brevis.AAC.1
MDEYGNTMSLQSARTQAASAGTIFSGSAQNVSTEHSMAAPVVPKPELTTEPSESTPSSASAGNNRVPQALPNPNGMPTSFGPRSGQS